MKWRRNDFSPRVNMSGGYWQVDLPVLHTLHQTVDAKTGLDCLSYVIIEVQSNLNPRSLEQRKCSDSQPEEYEQITSCNISHTTHHTPYTICCADAADVAAIRSRLGSYSIKKGVFGILQRSAGPRYPGREGRHSQSRWNSTMLKIAYAVCTLIRSFGWKTTQLGIAVSLPSLGSLATVGPRVVIKLIFRSPQTFSTLLMARL